MPRDVAEARPARLDRHCRRSLQRPVRRGRGTVIVPLLILWFGFGEREATATSLGAIVIIAAFAAFAQGLYGNVHVLEAVLVGITAIGGVVAGTALQQRISERLVSGIFAVLLVVSAAVLAF